MKNYRRQMAIPYVFGYNLLRGVTEIDVLEISDDRHDGKY